MIGRVEAQSASWIAKIRPLTLSASARQPSLYAPLKLACRAVARLSVVEPARLRALRSGAAAFVLASEGWLAES